MGRGMLRAASAGALLGSAAGAVVALGDFGASWLWQPLWLDRVSLLWRLLASEIPIGAVAGALLATLAVLTAGPLESIATRLGRSVPKRVARWQGRLSPVPFVLLAVPGIVVIAHDLFLGGKMSHVRGRGVLSVVVAVVLLAGTWAALRIGVVVVAWARGGGARRARILGAGLFAIYFAIAKVDQEFYAKLYEYLHAALGVAAWLVAGLAVAVLATSVKRLRATNGGMNGLVLLVPLLGLFALHISTLGDDQNVRVALFDPRAASFRSLMEGLEPLLRATASGGASASAIARAQREREARRRQAIAQGLPVLTNAHVLLITIDALRADHLGTYGYGRHLSPHIDALAKQSVVFDAAYAGAPHSSYSLCSVMTSQYLHETLPMGKPLTKNTLPRALEAVGFHTAASYTLGISTPRATGCRSTATMPSASSSTTTGTCWRRRRPTRHSRRSTASSPKASPSPSSGSTTSTFTSPTATPPSGRAPWTVTTRRYGTRTRASAA